MNYRLLIIGLLFLFNPEITIFDIFPDFIGFLLIARAIAPLSEVSPSAEAATSCFRKLAAVSGVKMLAFLPMLSIRNSEPSMSLLFTAGFAIATMIYLFPAFHDWFNAIRYFSEREAVRVRGIGFMRGFTAVTFVLRYLFALLPETVYLYADEEFSFFYGTPIYPLVAYRTGITVLSATLSTLVGIAWLTAILLFVRSLRRNSALNEGIAHEIASTPHSAYKTVLAAVRPAMICLSLAAFCAVWYTVDGMPLIPLAASSLLILIAMAALRKLLSLPRRYLVLPSLSVVSAFVTHILIYDFCESYHDRSAVGFDAIQKPFRIPAVSALVSALLLVTCLLVCVAPAVKKLINNHTGAFWEAAYLSHNSAVGKERQRQCFGVSVGIAMHSLAVLLSFISYTLYYVYPLLQLIASAFTIAVAVYFTATLSAVRQSAMEKYAEHS